MASIAAEVLKEARKTDYEPGCGWTTWPVWSEDVDCIASRPFQALYRDGSIVYDTGEGGRYGPHFKVAISKKQKLEALEEMLMLLEEVAQAPDDRAEFLEEINIVKDRIKELTQ